jgi:hypothetical protein
MPFAIVSWTSSATVSHGSSKNAGLASSRWNVVPQPPQQLEVVLAGVADRHR